MVTCSYSFNGEKNINSFMMFVISCLQIKGRTIRVDHVANYRPPKDSEDTDEITKALREKGCGIKTPPPSSAEPSEDDEVEVKRHKKGEKSFLSVARTIQPGKLTVCLITFD